MLLENLVGTIDDAVLDAGDLEGSLEGQADNDGALEVTLVGLLDGRDDDFTGSSDGITVTGFIDGPKEEILEGLGEGGDEASADIPLLDS